MISLVPFSTASIDWEYFQNLLPKENEWWWWTRNNKIRSDFQKWPLVLSHQVFAGLKDLIIFQKSHCLVTPVWEPAVLTFHLTCDSTFSLLGCLWLFREHQVNITSSEAALKATGSFWGQGKQIPLCLLPRTIFLSSVFHMRDSFPGVFSCKNHNICAKRLL